MSSELPANRATVAPLPKWREPRGLEAAKEGIRILARSMHTNAYLLGKTLLWTQAKVGPANFDEWFNHHVKLFSERTAWYMMAFAKLCDRAGFLVEYHPGLSATVALEWPPLPPGKFRILYADPPWRYDFSATDSRSIEAHYPSLAVEEICTYRDGAGRPVQELFGEPSVLFLWATKPKLREALQVIEAWGCEYRTNYVWVKQDNGTLQWGMGYWGRDAHELLLIAVRGDMPPPGESRRPATVILAPRTEYSRKPDAGYELIEQMFPDIPERVELFARRRRQGWVPWGIDP